MGEYKVVEKLTELDSLTSSTPHSTGHQAWRPSSNTSSTGSMLNMVAHDYKVAQSEKQELEAMLKSLESDTEIIETKIDEESDKMKRNMETLESHKHLLMNIANKIK